MKAYIGCSGFYYNHWRGIFYPEKLAKKNWLDFYTHSFSTVELNNSFYRMPQESAVRHWYEFTPPDFVFAVKGYRFITHLKKFVIDQQLKDTLFQFEHLVSLLKEKAGPVLWQLPGNFAANLEKLDKFCSLLTSDFQQVFEFRNEGWFTQEVYDVLKKHKHGLCIVSGPGKIPEVVKATSPVAYVRFHGKGSWYDDNYSHEALEDWHKKLARLQVKAVYAYFNNDVHGYAIENGKYFASLFAQH